jgi:hypothetical protein
MTKKEAISFEKNGKQILVEEENSLYKFFFDKVRKFSLSHEMISAALLQILIEKRKEFKLDLVTHSKYIENDNVFFVYDFRGEKESFLKLRTILNQEIDNFQQKYFVKG